jgi:cysteinyl-tRNA synthetase
VFEGKVTGKPVHPAVLRFELIKSHYRSNMNFTKKGLTDSANTVMKLIDLRQELESKSAGKMADVDLSHPVLNEFAAALADDLNIDGGSDDTGEAMRLELVAAREAKDYAKSDELRDQLIAAGYDVQIGKTEVTIKKKLA